METTKDDAMAVLLKIMPEDYDNLVMILKYGPDPPFEGIINALQEDERKREKRKDHQVEGE